jgi:hypothetical protein
MLREQYQEKYLDFFTSFRRFRKQQKYDQQQYSSKKRF